MISGIDGKYVYLSGPMTGCEDWNRIAFDEVQAECYEAGAAYVFNPAKDAPAGADERGHQYWMRMNAHELTQSTPEGEPFYHVLVQLPGWERSSGARLEREIAVMCGIEIKEVNIDV